jgi:hypothetical protein
MANSASRLCRLLFLPLALLTVHAQTVSTFEGIDASQLAHPELNVDPNGAIGTKQYMEWINAYYQAFDKVTFAPVWSAPKSGTSPFTTNGLTQCNNFGGGDVIILFDRLASRWVIGAHSAGPNYYYCIAISNTDNLASTTLKWFTYAFSLNSILGTNSKGVTYFPDWVKIGTWPDAYYVGIDLEDPSNTFQEVGVVACAFDRTNMLIGGTPNSPQCFTNPSPVTGSLYLAHSLEPADIEGTTPPATGSPEYFASIENPVNDEVTTTSDSFNLWQFHVDWSNTANSTFTQSTVSVPDYRPGCYVATTPGNTVCVPEPSTASTGESIDSVGDRFMFRFAYRNFGEYQSYLMSHTVQVGTGNGSQTGIRWYELRGNGTPALYQSGTISPDQSLYRFVPSIAEDKAGNAAVGYSVSDASTHPSISASWWNLNSSSSPAELSLFSGSGDEENSYHWGTYTSMTVDPVGGCAFWYLNEYYSQNQTVTPPVWRTRISTFSAPTCGLATVSPSSLTFGVQSVGTNSPTQAVILSNSQAIPLNISSISFGGTNPLSFSQTNDCGTSLPGGGTCTINVSFTPVNSGPLSATLSVTDDANNSPQTVSLSGTATGSPTLGFSPASVSFGNQAFGTSTAAVPITVTNTGASAVAISSIVVTGNNTSAFPESNTCPSSLAVGNKCTINVSFAPTASGSFSAAVTVTSNASGSPMSINLSGTGIAPVALSASSIAFGLVLTGSSKTASPIKLTNEMSVPLTGISVAVSGAAFSQTNSCGVSLAAGAQCTVSVTFAPTASGTQSGTVSITDSAANSPQTITLQGSGLLPVSFAPTSLGFGSVTVGTSSPPKTTTVTNNQKTVVTISSLALTGAKAKYYSQTNTCGSSLAGGASCKITVTFTPTITGGLPAFVTLTDSATNSPQTLDLFGTGD